MTPSNAKASIDDPDHFNRLINERDGATFLGYTVRALQNWRLHGGGPLFVRVSGRSIRYRRVDLINWAESRLTSSTSAPLPAAQA